MASLAPDESLIARQIQDLNDDDFNVRQRAGKGLERAGLTAGSALR